MEADQGELSSSRKKNTFDEKVCKRVWQNPDTGVVHLKGDNPMNCPLTLE